MPNSTLAVMRTQLRRLLNDSDSERFPQDTALNDWLQEAYEHYYREVMDIDSQYGQRDKDVTFTASAEYIDIDSMTDDSFYIERILSIEDRTDYQPGAPLLEAESFETLLEANYQGEISETTISSIYYIERIEAITSGVVDVQFRLYLGPKPGAARSLRLHIQINPQTFSTADTYTTGMPDYVEACMLFRAVLISKLHKENPNTQLTMTLLKEAEEQMLKHLRPLRRGPMRVISVPED